MFFSGEIPDTVFLCELGQRRSYILFDGVFNFKVAKSCKQGQATNLPLQFTSEII